MKSKDKSILDTVRIEADQKAREILRFPSPSEAPLFNGLGIISNCPQCGNPIYGDKVLASDQLPNVVRTCNCHPPSPFSNTVQNK